MRKLVRNVIHGGTPVTGASPRELVLAEWKKKKRKKKGKKGKFIEPRTEPRNCGKTGMMEFRACPTMSLWDRAVLTHINPRIQEGEGGGAWAFR